MGNEVTGVSSVKIDIPKDLVKRLQPVLKEEECSAQEFVIKLLEGSLKPVVTFIKMRLRDGAILFTEFHSLGELSDSDQDVWANLKEDYPDLDVFHSFFPSKPISRDALYIDTFSELPLADITEHALAWHREYKVLGRDAFIERYWDYSNYELHTPDPLPEYVAVDWGQFDSKRKGVAA